MDALETDDRRRDLPRFQGDNLQKNTRLLDMLKTLAAKERCTPGQLALAWLLSRPSVHRAPARHQAARGLRRMPRRRA